MTKRPVVVGVAGGTASGKTTISEAILDRVGRDCVAHISHDGYYRDLSALPFEERCRVNFDHPDSLESELLVTHLDALCSGCAVEVPVYDFSLHARSSDAFPESAFFFTHLQQFTHPSLVALPPFLNAPAYPAFFLRQFFIENGLLRRFAFNEGLFSDKVGFVVT